MVYRTRINYTHAQKAEIWDRWKRGESMSLKTKIKILDEVSDYEQEEQAILEERGASANIGI